MRACVLCMGNDGVKPRATYAAGSDPARDPPIRRDVCDMCWKWEQDLIFEAAEKARSDL